ncbi:unnamed protein product, partial [Ectocarpus sp. 12 AP-2014]
MPDGGGAFAIPATDAVRESFSRERTFYYHFSSVPPPPPHIHTPDPSLPSLAETSGGSQMTSSFAPLKDRKVTEGKKKHTHTQKHFLFSVALKLTDVFSLISRLARSMLLFLKTHTKKQAQLFNNHIQKQDQLHADKIYIRCMFVGRRNIQQLVSVHVFPKRASRRTTKRPFAG